MDDAPNPLGPQMGRVFFAGREVYECIVGYFDTELFFRPGVGDVMGPNPCFDMVHQYAREGSSLGPSERGPSVPLDEHWSGAPAVPGETSDERLRRFLNVPEGIGVMGEAQMDHIPKDGIMGETGQEIGMLIGAEDPVGNPPGLEGGEHGARLDEFRAGAYDKGVHDASNLLGLLIVCHEEGAGVSPVFHGVWLPIRETMFFSFNGGDL